MNRMKALRLECGYTQAKIGELIGCTAVSVSRYELEQRSLDPATIDRLCDIFGCTSDYLLCRSDIRRPQISAEEAELLAAYRIASAEARTVVELTLKPYLRQRVAEVS